MAYVSTNNQSNIRCNMSSGNIKILPPFSIIISNSSSSLHTPRSYLFSASAFKFSPSIESSSSSSSSSSTTVFNLANGLPSTELSFSAAIPLLLLPLTSTNSGSGSRILGWYAYLLSYIFEVVPFDESPTACCNIIYSSNSPIVW